MSKDKKLSSLIKNGERFWGSKPSERKWKITRLQDKLQLKNQKSVLLWGKQYSKMRTGGNSEGWKTWAVGQLSLGQPPPNPLPRCYGHRCERAAQSCWIQCLEPWQPGEGSVHMCSSSKLSNLQNVHLLFAQPLSSFSVPHLHVVLPSLTSVAHLSGLNWCFLFPVSTFTTFLISFNSA